MNKRLVFILLLALSVTVLSVVQEPPKGGPISSGPMLNDGFIELDAPEFTLKLVRSSQTVASLTTKGKENFDFTPGDLLRERSHDGYYHLGDLDLQLRRVGATQWTGYSSSLARVPVLPLPSNPAVLASADLTPTFGEGIPLRVIRSWAIKDGHLVLSFELRNESSEPVEIGALGIPMVFNNVLNDRSLDNAHALCVFYDPYIGEDAGYLQVTRLNGHGPAMLVVPDGHTPFEAYKPILDVHGRGEHKPTLFHDLTPRGVTFEGFYDWMIHSQSFAETDWNKAEQWNPPTKRVLAPGETITYGLKFLLSDSIRGIENTLSANGRPVSVGIPGYVLPTDLVGHLFLQYRKPVKSFTVEPPGSLALEPNAGKIEAWQGYKIRGKSWGRARLTLTYEDGVVQTVQYFVTKPESEVVKDLGHFSTTSQWFVDPQDHFGRSPSVMTYDRENKQIVMQDSRVWIAGLGDEGGGGAWLAAVIKEWVSPDKQELEKIEEFVDQVIWGHLQYNDGPQKNGVRKSLFYYQPDELPAGFYRGDLDWRSWTSWNKKDSERVDRSFDYPHVAAAYWVLYRLARNHPGLSTRHSWDWYLQRAYETSVAMSQLAAGYAEFGQMEGDIFVFILEDLKREGYQQQATQLESAMRARAEHWREQAFPFGSEMPWDSTGQEEVYAWMKYFGFQDKAQVTLDAVLGYDPTIPHWGYNGSARRYWDFLYAAKYSRIERQLHHYGSGLNAIPLLSAYRDSPDDFYLLRVGYGGTMGPLTNINQDGATSAAFHAFPDRLQFDPLSGDYGPNFFGHAVNTATYVVQHPEFGWVAFGGNLESVSKTIHVTPRDSFRSRLYVAPFGLWLTLDCGQFQEVEIHPAARTIKILLSPATQFTPEARLRVEQPTKPKGVGSFRVSGTWKQERGSYVVPLLSTAQGVEIVVDAK